MNKPEVVIHNTVCLDGSIKDFEANIGLHYQIAARYEADVHMIGSKTAKSGIGMYAEEVPPEDKSDFVKPDIKPGDKRPFWVIPDSKGILENLLHIFRRFEYCRDVVILVSKNTPQKYIDYLEERNYDYIVVGEHHVDYRRALEILYERYNARTVLMDSGGTLNSILLKEGLVDRISLIFSPVLLGKKSTNLFRSLVPEKGKIDLELVENEVIDSNWVLLVYKVLK